MQAFLLIAHGSRREQSNNEIRELTKKLKQNNSNKFDFIICCFLELSDPLIPEAIDYLASKSVKKITIFPYFLATGTHVAEDIPKYVDEAKDRHPNINLELLPHFGASENISKAISLSLSNTI